MFLILSHGNSKSLRTIVNIYNTFCSLSIQTTGIHKRLCERSDELGLEKHQTTRQWKFVLNKLVSIKDDEIKADQLIKIWNVNKSFYRTGLSKVLIFIEICQGYSTLYGDYWILGVYRNCLSPYILHVSVEDILT